MRGALRVLVSMGLIMVAVDARAWVLRTRPAGGTAGASDVAIAADGNPVVAGYWNEPSAQPDFLVTKRAASDGTEIWRYLADGLKPNSGDIADIVRVDSAGNVVALGSGYTFGAGFSDTDTIVVKLDGDDGSELWRVDLATGIHEFPEYMTLAADGDVLIAVINGPDVSTLEAMVYRLDGATGGIEWSTPVVGTAGEGIVFGLAVDQGGDVFCTGAVTDVGPVGAFLLAKLDGASGAETWRTALAGSNYATGGIVAVDATGDVVVGGQWTDPDTLDYYPLVAKFAGTTGAPIWRYDLNALPLEDRGAVADIALDGVGDVYVTGTHGDLSSFLTAKLAGGSGAEIWRGDLGDENGSATGYAVFVDPVGTPIVVGDVENDFALFGLHSLIGGTIWSYSLPGDPHNAGTALAIDFSAGYLFAAGFSVDPPIPGNYNQTKALTLVRIADPTSPPVVGNCTATPRIDCHATTAPGRSQLAVKVVPEKPDGLQWKWTRGEATATSDFGNPLMADTDYSFCVYDGEDARIFSLETLGGGTCGTTPCWRALGTRGFAYKNTAREPENVDKLLLRSGTAGQPRIILKRKERRDFDFLFPPLAGLAFPLTVQLQRDGGDCFGATFSASGVIKNDGVTLKARSD